MLHTRTSVDYMARLPQPSPQASHFWLVGGVVPHIFMLSDEDKIP